jgi:hypothetical protein
MTSSEGLDLRRPCVETNRYLQRYVSREIPGLDAT